MKTVLFNISTVKTEHPLGTVGGQWLFRYANQGSQTYLKEYSDTPDAAVELEVGAYWVKGQRLDVNGHLIGAETFAEFVVFYYFTC